MLFVMMMIEEMATVLIEGAVICLLKGEATIVGDRQVHTAEIELVLIMAMGPVRVLELNQEEVPSMIELQEEVLIMIELQAQSMIDTAGLTKTCNSFFSFLFLL